MAQPLLPTQILLMPVRKKQKVDVKSPDYLWESTFLGLNKLMSNHQFTYGNQLFWQAFSIVFVCIGSPSSQPKSF